MSAYCSIVAEKKEPVTCLASVSRIITTGSPSTGSDKHIFYFRKDNV